MNNALKAVIFDFDGVVADTEPVHLRTFRGVLAEEGLVLAEEEYERNYLGLTDAACFEAVALAQGVRLSPPHLRDLVARKSRAMQEAIVREVVVTPGVQRFVKTVAERYRVAIVSGALREEILLCLDRAGLQGVFEHITSAQDVGSGKPSPEPYLRALHHLALRRPLAAGQCLAIEDTPKGIQAAQAAGLRCLGVATTLHAGDLHEADAVTSSLEDCDFDLLAGRFWSSEPVQR
jgi:HAD superfamily hydrolase (TIGR01509 family)